MAFWSRWFASTCGDCDTKITEEEPVEIDGAAICSPCRSKRQEAKAKKQADIEARRAAEEEARRKFEDRKEFGTDPRYTD